MTSLFSPFDINNYSFCLLFMLLGLVLIYSKTFSFSLLGFSSHSLSLGLSNFFISLKPKYFNKSSNLMFISMIFFILVSNFFSVFSFNFPLTSQVSYVMFIGFTTWVSLIIYSLVFNTKGFLSHLIPEGTPLPLTILLFLIELISNMIRPLTLTVRLVANILAGHLLMSLLSSLIFQFPLAFMFYLGLNMVELFVALIQSYIFTTMIVLYFSEV